MDYRKPHPVHLFVLTVLLSLTNRTLADEITPVGVLATSEFGAIDVFGNGESSSVFATKLIDGSGLEDLEGTPDLSLDDYHDNDAGSANGWHAGDMDAGIPGGTDGDEDPFTPPRVAEQILEFDLGGLFQLTHAHIWQQNQANIFGPPFSLTRGLEEFEMLVSTASEGDAFVSLGQFTLDAEEALESVPAQILELPTMPSARRVRFHLASAYSQEPNEFVGLSEVRFEGIRNATPGDFDGDGELTFVDINTLSEEVRQMTNALEFDLNSDGLVNQDDRIVWVEELKRTYFGDANLDGQFNSTDFVTVFTAGEYEDATDDNSLWQTGDWNGDADFNSTDFVIAFQRGGYEAGPRAAANQIVPEPSGALLALVASCFAFPRIRSRSRQMRQR